MKAILFTRVSTEIQHLDEQERRVKRLALADGYAEADLILVSYKESGIRLTEENRLGITELKSLIQSDPDINAVYAFEVSRLARTKKVLFSLEEYLVRHRIQLVVDTPSIRLLNPDGSVNDSAEMVFTLYAQMAESEMRIKMERFRNGKERLRREGKYTGATLPMGYKVDEEGYIVIDEEGAAIVRQVYDMYTKGWSTTKLAEELTARGVPISQSVVANILSKDNYTGKKYPQAIISEELFLQCQEIRKNSKVARKNNFPSAYLANKLIVCPHCGYHYSAGSTTYRCFGRQIGKCENSVQISIKLLDRIIWNVARQLEVARLAGEGRKDVSDLREKIDTSLAKIENLRKYASPLPHREEKAKDLFVEGIITKEELKDRLSRIQKKREESEAEIAAHQSDIERMERMIAEIEHPKDFVGLFSRLHDDLPIEVEKQREIVRIHVGSVSLSDWKYIDTAVLVNPFKSAVKTKKYMLITIKTVSGNVFEYRFFPRWSFGKHLLQEKTQENGWFSLDF